MADRKVAVHQLIAQLRQFGMPDGGRRLDDVYHVQELTADGLAPSASVAVAAVQRLSAMLAGTPTPEEGSDRVSAYETAERQAHPDATPLEVAGSRTAAQLANNSIRKGLVKIRNVYFLLLDSVFCIHMIANARPNTWAAQG